MDAPLHNKSHKNQFAILELTDKQIIQAYWDLVPHLQSPAINIIEDSPCMLPYHLTDGRVTINGKKYYAYHVVCFFHWGRSAMEKFLPNKNRANSKCISHRCGIYDDCCVIAHMHKEPVWLNNERAHCHFCLKHIFLTDGLNYDAINRALDDGLCPHEAMGTCTRL